MRRINRTKEIIDRVFLVVFARHRRKVGDSDVDAAWRSATNRVSGYLVLPVAALMVFVILMLYSFKTTGVRIDQAGIWSAQIVGGVIVVIVAVLLDRRFKKYLLAPPALAPQESREEMQLVFRFRGIAIGTFVLVCLIGILWCEIRLG